MPSFVGHPWFGFDEVCNIFFSSNNDVSSKLLCQSNDKPFWDVGLQVVECQGSRIVILDSSIFVPHKFM